jgi:hypothetical protein
MVPTSKGCLQGSMSLRVSMRSLALWLAHRKGCVKKAMVKSRPWNQEKWVQIPTLTLLSMDKWPNAFDHLVLHPWHKMIMVLTSQGDDDKNKMRWSRNAKRRLAHSQHWITLSYKWIYASPTPKRPETILCEVKRENCRHLDSYIFSLVHCLNKNRTSKLESQGFLGEYRVHSGGRLGFTYMGPQTEHLSPHWAVPTIVKHEPFPRPGHAA